MLFGITWIGLLYFFNFVQVPAFAEMEAQARSEALRKITFRALWWFRWAAALTLASGLLMWAIGGSDYKPSTRRPASASCSARSSASRWRPTCGWSSGPTSRSTSSPPQTVADGGEADPAAAGAAKLAGRASRVNAFFSIPMLFFMVFTSHFAPRFSNPGGAGVDHVDPVPDHLGRRRVERAGQAPGRARQPVLQDGARQPHQDDRGRPDRRGGALPHRLGAGHRLTSDAGSRSDRERALHAGVHGARARRSRRRSRRRRGRCRLSRRRSA